jgi:hypothetical protein
MFKKMSTLIVAAAMIFTACSAQPKTASPGTASVQPSVSGQTNQESPKTAAAEAADQVKAHKEMVEELTKGQNGGKIDYEKVQNVYNARFKKLAQLRDAEAGDQQISSILKGGKDGSMQGEVVQQLVDKLGQKIFFLAMRGDFKELDAAFADKAKATQKLEEAKTFYNALKPTVEKRDNAYGTHMVSAIDGALENIAKAIDSGSKPEFSLARQVVDKTLMKTFYLATGGANGYAYKVEKAVSEGKDPKTEQAEGWAFYQTLYAYLAGEAKSDADFIQSRLDLKTNPKEIKGDEINLAFVRGFAQVAKSEYKASFENFDQDKGPITAMEGALFIRLIEADAAKRLGEAPTKTLLDQAGQLLEAVKAKDRAKAEALYKEIEPSLDKLAGAGK